jgi:D-alanyl-D-alanine carboxypeptidase/D-alanyl-D-alanine-endopeptidase (penicillin-binding protein 4)
MISNQCSIAAAHLLRRRCFLWDVPVTIRCPLRAVALMCALIAAVGATTASAAGTPPTPTPEELPSGIGPTSDVPPPMAPASAALTRLQRTLTGNLNRQGGENSALIVDQTTGRTLWAYNDTVARLPASAEKLYTTTAALLELGPAATFETKVLGAGMLTAAGTFVGTLYLRGGGDPSLGSSTFDHFNYGGSGSTMGWLASALKRDGVRRIQGAILGDASYLDSLRGGPDSHYRPNIETEGSLSALAYDAGFTNLHEDELDANPPLVATAAFAAALQRAGIRVPTTTRIATGVTPATATLLTSESSPTLTTLIRLTNSPSDNFFAETLLKDLGAEFGAAGSTVAGAAVVSSVIGQDLGLHPRLDDGSGLSRYDRTNARQIVLLLRELQGQQAFWNSLAIAGVRGTMIKEMRHTRAADNCRGKTGTLHDVANLVGYCRAANGDRIIFALMMSGLTDSVAGHQLEDLDAEALANYRG